MCPGRSYIGYGDATTCNRTGWSASSCETIRSLKRKCATLSVSIWIHLTARWCCAWTRRANSGTRSHGTDSSAASWVTGTADPRLQASRYDHAVCRFQYSQRQGHRHLPGASPEPRVHSLPKSFGTATPGRPGSSPDSGQLLHTQECRGPTVAQAEETEALSFSLHPDQQFVAESSGAILCLDHWTDDPPRHIPQRRRTREGDLQLARPLEWFTCPVRLEGVRRHHPRQGPSL